MLLGNDAEAQMLRAVLQWNIYHVVQRALIGEFGDAYGVKIGGGEQAYLLHAVIDIDDLRRVVQIYDALLCGNVVKKVLVLTNIADEAVGEQVIDIHLVDGARLQQLVLCGKKHIGLEFGDGSEFQALVFKVAHDGICLMYGEVHDTDLRVAVRHIIDHIAGAGLVQAEKEILLILMARADLIEADGRVREAGHGDDQAAALAMCLADKVIETLHLIQYHLAVGQEALPVSGEP